MNEDTEHLIKYDLRLKGIFGRNRTIKFDCITFFEAERSSPLSKEEAIKKANEVLESIKFKKGKWFIAKTNVELEHRDGFKVTKFLLDEYEVIESGEV